MASRRPVSRPLPRLTDLDFFQFLRFRVGLSGKLYRYRESMREATVWQFQFDSPCDATNCVNLSLTQPLSGRVAFARQRERHSTRRSAAEGAYGIAASQFRHRPVG